MFLPRLSVPVIFSLLSVFPYIYGQNVQDVGFDTVAAFAGYFDLSESRDIKISEAIFVNPALDNTDQGCTLNNLRSERYSKGISARKRIQICEALEGVSSKLKGNTWSPELKAELDAIWEVFLTQNVKIRPMKKGVSSRIAAMAEAFTDNEKGAGFNASLYLRPGLVKKESFFLVSMHELRHIYDFFQLWENQTGITGAELEKRGFKVMSKIARETRVKEKFKRLPKLWKDSWSKLSEKEINAKVDRKIYNYMRKSRFYRALLKNPDQHLVGYKTSNLRRGKSITTHYKENNGERLPYLVKSRQAKEEIRQNIGEISFKLSGAKNPGDPVELLNAAIANEKLLFYRMDNFVYDQNLELKCWKKQKVIESFLKTGQIARTRDGHTLYRNEKVRLVTKKRKSKIPSCLLNIEAIDTDATETFWSAPYLDEMPIKFDYFTEIDGIKVARYTVYIPTKTKFDKMAAQYPKINSFRVFFGTIFVSVEDSQIIKFWGGSFPEVNTTGYRSKRYTASYNATAIRQKLESGVWVTTKLNTVAVAIKKGKIRPFSYVVKYSNYRQGVTDVLILDEEIIAAMD